MSYADKLFIDMCNNILENGTDTKGEKVRPHWADGTPAYTQKLFCVVNRYDLRKEFPALTLRRTALNPALTKYFGYGRKNQTIFMIFTPTFGIHGLTRTALSARHTATSSESSINIRRACSIRLTVLYMTSKTIRSAAES